MHVRSDSMHVCVCVWVYSRLWLSTDTLDMISKHDEISERKAEKKVERDSERSGGINICLYMLWREQAQQQGSKGAREGRQSWVGRQMHHTVKR